MSAPAYFPGCVCTASTIAGIKSIELSNRFCKKITDDCILGVYSVIAKSFSEEHCAIAMNPHIRRTLCRISTLPATGYKTAKCTRHGVHQVQCIFANNMPLHHSEAGRMLQLLTPAI